MNPIFIAAAVVGAILVFGKNLRIPNPLNPNRAGPAGPGPGAQAAGKSPLAGLFGGFSPPNFAVGTGTGSPNSTLATVNGSVVVANNALGFFDQVGQYFGSNDDSEYPVDNTGTLIAPAAVIPPTPSIGDIDFSNPADSVYA